MAISFLTLRNNSNILNKSLSTLTKIIKFSPLKKQFYIRFKVTINDIRKLYQDQKPITVLTAYDYPTGLFVEKAGIDICLVGDSLGMVALGYKTTNPTTLDEMLYHCRAVSRGISKPFLIGDMPFGSYEISPEKHGEGGSEMADTIRKITSVGIPVLGHLGLTPQRQSSLGGFKVQGKTVKKAKKILEDAKSIQDAGCFAMVLEAIPEVVGTFITKELNIPTIGIGAGRGTSGQVLVQQDMLGVFDKFTPSFSKKYGNLDKIITDACISYREEVKNRIFPGEEHCYSMDKEELKKFMEFIDEKEKYQIFYNPIKKFKTCQLTHALTKQPLVDAFTQVSTALRNAAKACDEFQLLVPRDVGIIPGDVAIGGGGSSSSTTGFHHHIHHHHGQSTGNHTRKFKKNQVKDPNAPKRPNTAYILFSNEIRPETKLANPKANQKEIVTLIGQKWKALSREQKKVYEDRYFADKEKYDEELRAYRATHGHVESPISTSSNEDNGESSSNLNNKQEKKSSSSTQISAQQIMSTSVIGGGTSETNTSTTNPSQILDPQLYSMQEVVPVDKTTASSNMLEVSSANVPGNSNNSKKRTLSESNNDDYSDESETINGENASTSKRTRGGGDARKAQEDVFSPP
ncbi:2832_t:CDS:10, partial [Entrophospora sp. SA101]